MSEPRWMGMLDTAAYRAQSPAGVAAAWAWWCIARLPPKARALAAKSWLKGKLPGEVSDELDQLIQGEKS